MAKKKFAKLPDGSNGEEIEASFEVKNLTKDILPVPYFKVPGRVSNLHVRIQGRGGQKPPVVTLSQVTPEMREMEKRGLIKLNKVS